MFDIRMIGDKELQAALRRLPDKLEVRAIAPPMRRSARRTKDRLLLNASGRVIKEQTGTLVAAFEAVRLRRKSKKGQFVMYGVPLPGREALGIDQRDRYYYPYAIEYGHRRAPAHPFIRKSIDDYREKELQEIGADIGRQIRKYAGKA